MKVYVIGSGAMGSVYGGRLSKGGHDVTLIDTWHDHVQAIARFGLLLDGIRGEDRIAVEATDSPDELDSGAELAIISVDANSTGAAAQLAKRLLGPSGYALTLQNGIGNVETLSTELGTERVLCGLSYHSAVVKGPGHVTQTHYGPTRIGEIDGRSSKRLAKLERAFGGADLNPATVDDILAWVWDKWVLNSAINPVSAITGLREGEIARTAEVDEFQTRIIDEILAVVAARKIRLHDPNIKKTIKIQCWKKFNKPSMQQHLEAGKQTEIDALNGAVVRLAREVGVPTPYNEALTMLVKGAQKARRQLLHEPPIDYAAMETEATKTDRPDL